MKVAAGKTPPRADEDDLLAVVASEKGDTVIVAARVLTVDASTEPADITVAVKEADALRVAAIPKPQITLMQRPMQEKR